MGRAVLIICTGVLVSLGFVGLGALQQGTQVSVSNVSYVEQLMAKNAAHTAIQMAMDSLYDDPNWPAANPWTIRINNSNIQLNVEKLNPDESSPNFYDPDTLRITSTAYYQDSISEELTNASVVHVYVSSAINEFVPQFESAITITASDINLSSDGSGTATISGIDKTGECVDKPAFSLINESITTKVNEFEPPFDIEGDVLWKPDLNYNPTQELISRFEAHDEVTHIKNHHHGAIGTQSDPGVFFVDNSAQIDADIEEGYGILVFRSGGSLAIEDSAGNTIPVAENFTFNGLSIFENAYEIDVQNVPSVNGTLLIGETEDEIKNTEIKITGNMRIQYDCTSEEYAKKAAAQILPHKRYRRISTFE